MNIKATGKLEVIGTGENIKFFFNFLAKQKVMTFDNNNLNWNLELLNEEIKHYIKNENDSTFLKNKFLIRTPAYAFFRKMFFDVTITNEFGIFKLDDNFKVIMPVSSEEDFKIYELELEESAIENDIESFKLEGTLVNENILKDWEVTEFLEYNINNNPKYKYKVIEKKK